MKTPDFYYLCSHIIKYYVMHVVIKDIEDPSEVKLLEDIQREVWKGEEIVVPSYVMIAAREVGGVLLGAYLDDKLIGFVFGFQGEFKGYRCMYSHQLAVLDPYQNYGVGTILKLKQREDALRKGFKLIVWTYDPLRSKNAILNINKLGCITNTYLPNHYGEMTDELNRGVPSDRFMVEWWIDSKWYFRRIRYRYYEDWNKDIHIILEARREGEDILPIYHGYLNRDTVGVEIPVDIDNVGRNPQEMKVTWRMRTREVFTELFSMGYIIVRYMLYKNHDYKGVYILKKGFSPEDPGSWI